MIGSTEILIIAVVVLVLFGGAAIPKFARSLGKAQKEFKDGLAEGAADEGSASASAKKDGAKNDGAKQESKDPKAQ
jgi:sec-independent protein translocase protein TatA